MRYWVKVTVTSEKKNGKVMTFYIQKVKSQPLCDIIILRKMSLPLFSEFAKEQQLDWRTEEYKHEAIIYRYRQFFHSDCTHSVLCQMLQEL